ncbi:MAG: efflux RND transporter permease subunit, partial [Planctomycetes bacterium]|nr:efflux RND transporter permease subunit [Planctomycetota bacterium]
MLARLVSWSLSNHYLVLGVTIVVALAGVLSLNALSIDAFPDTTPVQVQVNTASPSLVPEEVERLISLPVEQSLGGLPGLKMVRSLSQFGLSRNRSQVGLAFSTRSGVSLQLAWMLLRLFPKLISPRRRQRCWR